ncbi:MAG: SDR family NAD(P)-dependent oxidoreductase [Elusimicrobia bacterium]|nr:SDR family NAD(P)-dependent oxidoreductase [Elusimicrobiota bacterium]
MRALLLSAVLALPAAAAPGKVAVITGAASGIGRALAEEAGARGWRLVLADKDARGLAETVRRVRERGGAAEGVTADVASDADRARLLGVAVSSFGAVDLLVNDAGAGYMADAAQLSLPDARAQFETDFFAVVDLSRRALALMKKRGGGKVVNVASVLGLTPGLPEGALYAAAKHAVVGWTRSEVPEFARAGVTLKLACPGGVKTPFFDHMTGPGADAVRLRLRAEWEDYDSAPRVARDILDGLAAKGPFIFPGRAASALPPGLLRALEE